MFLTLGGFAGGAGPFENPGSAGSIGPAQEGTGNAIDSDYGAGMYYSGGSAAGTGAAGTAGAAGTCCPNGNGSLDSHWFYMY